MTKTALLSGRGCFRGRPRRLFGGVGVSEGVAAASSGDGAAGDGEAVSLGTVAAGDSASVSVPLMYGHWFDNRRSELGGAVGHIQRARLILNCKYITCMAHASRLSPEIHGLPTGGEARVSVGCQGGAVPGGESFAHLTTR